MSETPSGDIRPPAAANTDQPPLAPEIWLRDNFSGVVDGVIAHYADQEVRASQKGSNPMAPGRTIRADYFRDGTERDTITDSVQGTTTTKVLMSKGITDPHGRRVLVMTTDHPDGRKEYEMRFLPRVDQNPTRYTWSLDQPLMEGQPGESRPIAANTQEFTQAWALGAQFQDRSSVLFENKKPNGSVRTGRVAGRLIGALATAAARRLKLS